MSYPEDSVGARMDFEMVSIREEVTIDMVLRYLRRFKERHAVSVANIREFIDSLPLGYNTRIGIHPELPDTLPAFSPTSLLSGGIMSI